MFLKNISLSNISLRRITSSSFYLPQIDGLRFIPILLVVLAHVTAFIVNYSASFTNSTRDDYFILNLLMSVGSRGVVLFFVISGFILAYPFAKQHINKQKTVNVGRYFLRRITRLEPPYIIALLLNIILLLVISDLSIKELLNSFLLSAFYIHNFFGEAYWISVVTWSLEIEIQFYLLAPFISLIYLLKGNLRRISIIAIIFFWTFFERRWHFKIPSLIEFLPYFLLGFLLADLYVTNIKINISKYLSIPIGLFLLIFIIFLKPNQFYGQIFLLLGIFIFYYLVLNSGFWIKVFSLKFMVVIGGMCYSIYLIHPMIMSLIGFNIIKYNFFNNNFVNHIFQGAIIIIGIIIFSGLFYLLIERPCMDKNWPVKLFHFFKSKLIKIGSKVIDAKIIN